MNKDQYQVGGSLRNHDPNYVYRKADIQIYEALKQGELCYVFNSRQMGKSSLLVKTKYRLETEGFHCVALDMTSIGCEYTTPMQWYKGVIFQLWLDFNLSINIKTWWEEQNDLSYSMRLNRFISDVLLVEFPTENLVILIDEIDTILSLDFSLDDFFALIRFCYNQRAINPAYSRINFALFGVATPTDLIADNTRTPFNLGKAIALDGFTFLESQPLLKGLQDKVTNPQVILQKILTWTGGQPFLTQKLCKLIVESPEISQGLNIAPGKEELWIENLVKQAIINNWESQDNPVHLRTIRHRLLNNEQRARRLLGIYQEIFQKSEGVAIDNSREQMELLLSGLVIKHQGYLKVKNRIYQKIFNSEWVKKQLTSLRPYSQMLDAWIESNKTDQSRLLRGKALNEALTWANGKSLTDLDYQFLAASQELNKTELENTLNTLQLAHQLLSQLRLKVKLEPLRKRIWRGLVLLTALCVTISLILLRLTGFFQGIEWELLDQFFRLRPSELVDSRIVIVTIDESDITHIGHWPVSDAILTEILTNIKAQNPSAIGLDLYRDLPVQPGYQQLVEMFSSTPNLIGIEKIVGSKVAPPSSLNKLGQVGFADVILDADGKIRRGLLSVKIEDKIHLSFALRLALIYLEKFNITPQMLDDERVKLGEAIFVPFTGNNGGYVNADAGGYQILLNFRGGLEHFKTISLTEVLTNKIPPKLMKNSIVLIGTIAPSLNDLFYTPYSSRIFKTPQRNSGVVIHANIISQILSSALEKRPSIKTWRETQEWLWIFIWSLIGAFLSWQLHDYIAVIFSIFLASLGIILLAYLAFLQGWWISLALPIFGLVIAAIALRFLTNKHLEKLQLRRLCDLLLQECDTCPTVGLIAIEIFKQSESDQNQVLIEQWLKKVISH